ncbi:UbiA family prenyltransferase [Aquabacterium humicola]|uniref:UbiA family prenyltransferase n=1 Tax=Aquabacterium humicola TaxID=3237377 RepID=UPI002542CDFB|nr:UbiA family prenyltransferase [Rubrivivax pictus]
MSTRPLVVDLDGTLIHTDMLHESALRVLRDKPWDTLYIPVWLAGGKALLKQRLALRSSFDPAGLPYNLDFLAWLREQRAGGRTLVLCTAADASIAEAIAQHLGLFDEVIASDGRTNLSGRHKADALAARYGARGFDYAGNSRADLPVWERAHGAVVVNASAALARQARTLCEVERIFPPPRVGFTGWRRALRLHQWLKNLLLFVPLAAGHRFDDAGAWLRLLLAFFAFSLCASAVYVANDLMDLESDRRHPRKRERGFASGHIPVWRGVVLAPVLLAGGFALAAQVSQAFLGWMGLYFLATCAYSWGLKRIVLVDCLLLAMLYTLRIVAGTAAAQLQFSFWLLAFSVFLFLSLAFVKRYAELALQAGAGVEAPHGRGYRSSDSPLLQTMGVTSGYAAVLVLALYINSASVQYLYRAPELVWGTLPLVLFWISRMWMKAHRGQMHDDPLVFAVKDVPSLIAGLLFGGVLALGAVGWPWSA